MMGHIISSRDVVLEGLDKTLYEIVLDQSSDPIFCFDPEGRYLYINQAFSNAFKLMPSDIVGKKIWDIFPGEQGDMRYAAVKKAFETKEEVVVDVKVDAHDGVRYYMTSARPIMDKENIPRFVICISKEITERKRMEQALKSAKEETELKNSRLDMAVKELYIKSITDGLTKLFNRQHIIDLLEESIQKYHRRNYDLSIALIDIDHYKRINDTYGHLIGDEALVEFSALMMSAFEYIGDIGRYGGEEFLIILPNVNLQDANDMLDSFRKQIESHVFTSKKITFTFSAGITLFDGQVIDDIIQKVDDLMYESKASGRNAITSN